MSEPVVTEADREKAAEAWEEARELGVVEAIAAALAAERAKAREPFQRLADEIEAACRGRQDVISMTMRDDAALIRATLDDNQ